MRLCFLLSLGCKWKNTSFIGDVVTRLLAISENEDVGYAFGAVKLPGWVGVRIKVIEALDAKTLMNWEKVGRFLTQPRPLTALAPC